MSIVSSCTAMDIECGAWTLEHQSVERCVKKMSIVSSCTAMDIVCGAWTLDHQSVERCVKKRSIVSSCTAMDIVCGAWTLEHQSVERCVKKRSIVSSCTAMDIVCGAWTLEHHHGYHTAGTRVHMTALELTIILLHPSFCSLSITSCFPTSHKVLFCFIITICKLG